MFNVAFGGGSDNPHLPHNHEKNQVVYSGTHDNDTVYLPTLFFISTYIHLKALIKFYIHHYCPMVLTKLGLRLVGQHTKGRTIYCELHTSNLNLYCSCSALITCLVSLSLQVLKYLSVSKEDDIWWAMTKAALSSISQTTIVPMQDILGLGSDARMNTPATQV